MKIVHVATRHRFGGAEANLVNAVNWEVDRGHSVDVVVGRDSVVHGFADETRVRILPQLEREVNAPADLKAFRALRRFVASEHFDVIHTHQSKAGILGRVAARGFIPVVVHTIHMPSFGSAFSPLPSNAFLRLERYCAEFTDVLVAVGAELVDIYLEASIGSAEKYIVIRSPIEIEKFAALRSLSEHERQRARQEFGLAPDLPTLLAIGTLDARKRHVQILEWLAPLLRDSRTQMAIAGDGPELGRLRLRAEELGIATSVRVLGRVDEPDRLFAAATVLVHAAIAEGVSQVIIQALAAGVPVVATHVEGLFEVDGAPVEVVPRDGRGFLEAVADICAGSRPRPVSLDGLAQWTAPEVSRQLTALHESIQEALRLSASPPRNNRTQLREH